jgi:type VI secretion system protein ImpH
MAAEERESAALVAARRFVVAAARTSSFFEVVAALERLSPGAVRVGGDGPPGREAVRFRHDPSMGFSAGDITSAVLRNNVSGESRVDLVCTFLGLTGAIGPLPLHICGEVAHEELAGGNRRRFLDVFHHRLLSLLYRLWSRLDLVAEIDSATRDAWSARALCLAGYDLAGAASDPVPIADRLHLLPATLGLPRTAHGLRLGLLRVLKVQDPEFEVRIEQFTGGFVALDPAHRMRLGRPTAVLGQTSVLGSRMRDPASAIRLHLGPLPAADSSDYLAGGRQFRMIEAFVDSFVREPLDYELRLYLGGGRRPGFRLSKHAAEPLGRRSFLRGGGARQVLTVRRPAKTTH